jgi:hypothetical protein
VVEGRATVVSTTLLVREEALETKEVPVAMEVLTALVATS